MPFSLGRPLGVPGDAGFQIDVLRTALGLLETKSTQPVLEFYESDVPQQGGEEVPWSCPVSFGSAVVESSWYGRVLNEMNLLRPWYDRSLAANNVTTVGLSRLEPTSLPGFLAQFLGEEVEVAAPEGLSLADALKCAAEDLKAFYSEAAIAQPGNASARDIEDWYWNQCDAGKLTREIREVCGEHPDQVVRTVARFTLVPQSQLAR